jgi:hypothetical protein
MENAGTMDKRSKLQSNRKKAPELSPGQKAAIKQAFVDGLTGFKEPSTASIFRVMSQH